MKTAVRVAVSGKGGLLVLVRLLTNMILKVPEGRILLAGVVMTLLLVGAVCYFGVVNPEYAKTLMLVFVAHTVGGRAAGVGLCIMHEFNLVVTLLYNFYIELLIICYVYAAFVLSVKNYIRQLWLNRLIDKIAVKALKHKDKVENHGWIGLFVFVMIPLPVTGPVAGIIIGYLLRIPFWRNFSAVSLGTFSAIVVWVVGFDFLNRHFHAIQWVFVAIIGVVIISYSRALKQWFR